MGSEGEGVEYVEEDRKEDEEVRSKERERGK